MIRRQVSPEERGHPLSFDLSGAPGGPLGLRINKRSPFLWRGVLNNLNISKLPTKTIDKIILIDLIIVIINK